MSTDVECFDSKESSGSVILPHNAKKTLAALEVVLMEVNATLKRHEGEKFSGLADRKKKLDNLSNFKRLKKVLEFCISKFPYAGLSSSLVIKGNLTTAWVTASEPHRYSLVQENYDDVSWGTTGRYLWVIMQGEAVTNSEEFGLMFSAPPKKYQSKNVELAAQRDQQSRRYKISKYVAGLSQDDVIVPGILLSIFAGVPLSIWGIVSLPSSFSHLAIIVAPFIGVALVGSGPLGGLFIHSRAKKYIEGEVLSIKVEEPPTRPVLEAKLQRTVITEFDDIAQRVQDEKINKIIEEIRSEIGIVVKSFEKGNLEASHSAQLSLIFTSKLIPTLNAYLEVYELAATPEEKQALTTDVEAQLRIILESAKALRKSLFDSKRNVLDAQHLYLMSDSEQSNQSSLKLQS